MHPSQHPHLRHSHLLDIQVPDRPTYCPYIAYLTVKLYLMFGDTFLSYKTPYASLVYFQTQILNLFIYVFLWLHLFILEA